MIDRTKYPPLNLPVYTPKVRSNDGQIQIFDRIRKKYLVLTPEEWVRQHFVNYLNQHLGYPESWIRLEFGVSYNKLTKRPDIGVVNSSGGVEILIECKAPTISLNEAVFLQLTTYFSVLKPTYVVMTNGLVHVVGVYQPNEEKFVYIETLPSYK